MRPRDKRIVGWLLVGTGCVVTAWTGLWIPLVPELVGLGIIISAGPDKESSDGR